MFFEDTSYFLSRHINSTTTTTTTTTTTITNGEGSQPVWVRSVAIGYSSAVTVKTNIISRQTWVKYELAMQYVFLDLHENITT